MTKDDWLLRIKEDAEKIRAEIDGFMLYGITIDTSNIDQAIVGSYNAGLLTWPHLTNARAKSDGSPECLPIGVTQQLVDTFDMMSEKERMEFFETLGRNIGKQRMCFGVAMFFINRLLDARHKEQE
jgi:hypothetical protein